MTTKKKMGRPKLPKGEARTEILPIRLTKTERMRVESRAKDANKGASEWVRDVILSP